MMVAKGKSDAKETQVALSKQNRQKLTDIQILTLASLCRRIEKHYASPQDIEWAYAKGRFYITQSRSVTTL